MSILYIYIMFLKITLPNIMYKTLKILLKNNTSKCYSINLTSEIINDLYCLLDKFPNAIKKHIIPWNSYVLLFGNVKWDSHNGKQYSSS